MTAPTRVTAFGGTTGAVNATTLAMAMTTAAASAQVGDKVACFCACDGVASQSVSSGTGWTKIDQQSDAVGTQCNLAMFEFDVVSAGTVPDLTIDLGGSQMAIARAILIRPPSGQTLSRILAKVGGDSADPDPPAATNSTGASIDALSIAVISGDLNTDTSTTTGVPSGYTSINQTTIGNTQGVLLSSADRAVTIANAASENPGPFTKATSEQWAAMTALYYATGGGGSTTGQIKVWNGSAWVAKPVKIWNGTSWVTRPVKRWNGSSWVTTPY